MCLRNAAELSVPDVAACIKVDDTVPGIEEGLAAGMWTVGCAVSGNEVGLAQAEWEALDERAKDAHRKRATGRLLAGARIT
jgi:phosphonoacetaldehyde hydrolase